MTENAIERVDDALEELAIAKGLAEAAQESMGDLGAVTDLMEKGASGVKGEMFKIIATYAALGAIAGGLASNVFGDDPCDQRVIASVSDYVINLKQDAIAIDVDHPLIDGFWSTENAKTFDVYEQQEVGVYFENLGLQETDAIYGVASFAAMRHIHAATTIIPEGEADFGPFNVPDEKTETHIQKYHLKFVTSPQTRKVELLPQETYGCLQGSLFGETGEDALPKVKLSWDWSSDTGIARNSCDFDNGDGIYCDATQFSIALSKRMQDLKEFLAQNPHLPCPTNPAITNLEEMMEEYNTHVGEIGYDPAQLYYDDCWVPISTTLWDGTPALLYFVEEANQSGDVTWTTKIPDIGTLEKMVHFKARLIKDGYSEDFQKDFADFYTASSFYNSPVYFDSEGEGKWADYFWSRDKLRFKQRFVENTSLPDAGVYDVLLNIGFESGSWEFFDSFGDPSAKAVVEFVFLDDPYPNSVFYYLPFNGNVGVESTNGRNGYGMGYSNEKGPIAIASQPELVSSTEIYGSNPVAQASVDVVSEFKTLNSVASKRGFLLELEGAETASSKNISFYPNYATPVLMRMSSTKRTDPFSAFYELRNVSTPVEAGTSLTFWTGAGQCLDYSGTPVYEAFRFKPDREANEQDPLGNWQLAYATDWDKADYAGEVFLKTVFYSPIAGSYNLKALQPSELLFRSPNTTPLQIVELRGINGMRHNDGLASDVVSEVQEVFDLVEDGAVCVTDSGQKTAFWWNPRALNEAIGSITSMEAIESGLVANSTCIG